MLATINTDAGFSPIHNVGSFAYWIKTDTVRILKHGVLRGDITDSLEAEIKAIGNAMHHLFGPNGVPHISKVIINTDCVGAVIAIRNRKNKPADTPARIAAEIVKTQIETCGVQVEFRHVKGHAYTAENHLANSARHYVNNWCDEKCTIHLREAIEAKVTAARERARAKFKNKYKHQKHVKGSRFR